MENQSNALLSLPYYSHGKKIEELRQSLLYTTLELDQTKIFAYDEIRKRNEQLIHFKDILITTIKERDEALHKYQLLMFDQQNKHITLPSSGASSIEDEQVQPQQLGTNKSFSSSDCEESIMSPIDHVMNQPLSHFEEAYEIIDPLLPDKPLPENGKLLQAIIKAGPLLQTLLLAGPLPQWRHPPPPLKTFEIPPVTIQCPTVNNGCGNFNRKRLFSDGSYPETIRNFFSTDWKFQTVLANDL